MRIRELLADDTDVLLIGDGPDGVAVLRYRRSLWTPGRECYLAELYVTPPGAGTASDGLSWSARSSWPRSGGPTAWT